MQKPSNVSPLQPQDRLAKLPAPKASKPRDRLAVLAEQIKRCHKATVQVFQDSVLNFAMKAGDLLLEAKEQIPHGQWGEWVGRHCEMSDRTARLYMQLAQNRGAVEAKSATVADLTLQGAAKAIAAPKTKSTAHTTTVQPANEFKKRSTKHDLMAVWLNTPAEERLQFMADVGLMFRRDAAVHEAAPTPQPKKVSRPPKKLAIPDDLSIPQFLKVPSPTEVEIAA